MRIAVWSGPRNLSTAMMYAFGARADTTVWDEPFYAAYLAVTGLDHPMKDAIIAGHEADPQRVADRCADPLDVNTEHFYMKHMPHHMIPGMPLDWTQGCIHVHLIRHPARVIASYGAKRDTISADDIGFRQQTEVFDALGGVVIDSEDIRRDPETALTKLCDQIGLSFDPAMLSWPAGGCAEDGVWAAHWYGAIHRSTGFAGPEGPMPEIPAAHQQLLKEAMPHYRKLWAKRLLV